MNKLNFGAAMSAAASMAGLMGMLICGVKAGKEDGIKEGFKLGVESHEKSITHALKNNAAVVQSDGTVISAVGNTTYDEEDP